MLGLDLVEEIAVALEAALRLAGLDAAAELFHWLSTKLGIPWVLYEDFPRGFWYHRALCNTVCPQNFPGDVIFAADEDLPC